MKLPLWAFSSRTKPGEPQIWLSADDEAAAREIADQEGYLAMAKEAGVLSENEEVLVARLDMAGALKTMRAYLELEEESYDQITQVLSEMIEAVEKLETAAESIRDRIRCAPQRELLNAVDEFLTMNNDTRRE